MKIAVVDAGYVGLANAVLLAQHNEIVVLDANSDRVAMINRGESTVEDTELEQFLKEKQFGLVATTESDQAYTDADYVVIATPTNYNPDTNYFDTATVEAVVSSKLSQHRKSFSPNACKTLSFSASSITSPVETNPRKGDCHDRRIVFALRGCFRR